MHASRPFREMITRPKISGNEWKTTEIGVSEVGSFAPFSCPEARDGRGVHGLEEAAAHREELAREPPGDARNVAVDPRPPVALSRGGGRATIVGGKNGGHERFAPPRRVLM